MTADDVDLVEVPDQLRPRGVQVAISAAGLTRLVDDLEAGVDHLVHRVAEVLAGDQEHMEHFRQLATRPAPTRTGQLR